MNTSIRTNWMSHLKLNIIPKSLSEAEVAALYLLIKANQQMKKMKKRKKLSLTVKLNLMVEVSKLKVANLQAPHLNYHKMN